MADYQRVVEYLRDVRQTISSGNTVVTDELRQAATDYAELCARANDRLRQVSAFLSQGLRSEAIHLADDNPNLLDLVAALDLPDAAQWSEFCQLNDLPSPPALQMDRAQQLSDAYAADQPLESLLNRHRLLALARAPVGKRLDVLRQISAADPSNPNWEKDVRVFEKARLKELPKVFYRAMKNKDMPALTALNLEVNGNTWFEPPPADLSTALGEAFRRIQRADVDTQLRELVPAMRDAYAARDYDQSAAMVRRWKQVMETAEVTTCAPELAHEVQPVVEWLRAEDELRDQRRRFDRACETLTQLLDSGASETDLEAAHARIATFGEGVPQELQARYEARRASQQQTHDRAHRTRLITIGASMLILLAMAGGAAWYFVTSGEAARWARNMNEAVAAASLDYGKIDAAKNLVARQEREAASVNGSADIKAVKERLKRVIEERDEKLATLARMTQALSAALEIAKPIAARITPEETALPSDRALSVAADIGAALAASADDVSQVDTEKRVDDLRRQLTAAQTKLIEYAKGRVTDEMRQVKRAIDAVPTPPAGDTAAVSDALARLSDLADRLGRFRTAGIDAAAIAEIDQKIAEVAKRRKDLEDSNALAASLQRVRDAATSADELRMALDAFIAEHPNRTISDDFRAALAAIPAAKAMEAYRATVRTWAPATAARIPALFPPAVKPAAERLKEVQKFLADNPATPMAKPLGDYAAYLKRMVDALGDPEKKDDKRLWNTGFEELLENPLLKDLSIIETSKGRKFYVLTAPKINESGVNADRVWTFNIMNPRKPSDVISQDVRTPETLVDGGRAKLSAHAQFVGDLSLKLKTIGPENWETFGIDTIEKLTANAEIDPVVRAMLIYHTLIGQQAVLGTIDPAYDKVHDALKNLDPDSIVFYDPARPVAPAVLEEIDAILKKLPRAENGRKAIAEKKAALANAVMFVPESTGVLFRDTGTPRIEAKGVHDGAAAYTVIPGSRPAAPAGTQPDASLFNAPSRLVRIADYRKDAWVLSETAPRDLPSGTLLFIVSGS